MATDLLTAISYSKHYSDGTKDFNTIVKDGSTSPYFTQKSDASALNNWGPSYTQDNSKGYWYLGDTSIYDTRFTNGSYVQLPAINGVTTDSSFGFGYNKLQGANKIGVYNNGSYAPCCSPQGGGSRWLTVGVGNVSGRTGYYSLTINASDNTTTSSRNCTCLIYGGDDVSHAFKVYQSGMDASSAIPLYIRVRWPANPGSYLNCAYAVQVKITGEGDEILGQDFNYEMPSNTYWQATVNNDSSSPFITSMYQPVAFISKSTGSVTSANVYVGVLPDQNYNFYYSYKMTPMYAKPGFDPAATVWTAYTPAQLSSSSMSSANRMSYIGSTQYGNVSQLNMVPIDGTSDAKLEYWRVNGVYNSSTAYTTQSSNSSIQATVGAFFVDVELY